MTDRLGPIPFAQMSAAQQVAAQAVIDGPRGALYGPFVPLIRSPELMQSAQTMGEYLRYRSAIGTRLSELAILVTARQWSQQVDDALYGAALERFGEHGVVDLIGLNGYYTFLAMVMNAARTTVPVSSAAPLPL